LPIRLFSLSVSCAIQPATYSCELCQTNCYLQLWAVSHNLLLTAEEHSSLLARRTVFGPPSGLTFDRTGRATPKRDCCTQLHACTVGSSCHCTNVQFITLPFPQAKKLFFCFWLANHAHCYTRASKFRWNLHHMNNYVVPHWIIFVWCVSENVTTYKMT